MNEPKTPTEQMLWSSILNFKLQQAMQDSPGTAVNEIIAETYKDYLEQKWINLVDTDKPHFTIDQYREFGNAFGPDLTAIPRMRYNDLKGGRKSGTEKKTRKLSAYNYFIKAMKDKGFKINIVEMSKRWNDLTPEEKAAYEQADLPVDHNEEV